MKIFIIIIAGIITAAVLFIFISLAINSRPLSRDDAAGKINRLVLNAVSKNSRVTGGIVMIKSDQANFDQIFTAGTAGGSTILPDQPFHSASVGKAFTATLIGVLIDRKLISLEDHIDIYLPPELLSGQFEADGRDYSGEVKVSQLLNHTSGIADYFEDKAAGSPTIKQLILSEPDRFWTPEDLIAFTRDFQKPAGNPGEKFHYSDTGYILLGLIIEEVSGMRFHEFLHDAVFTPLGMNDSYLMFYSEPKNPKRPVADIVLGGVRINDYKSLSIDWAGGGIISTAEDMAVFIRALNSGRIISRPTLESLYTFNQRYMRGIHYGNGFMEYHFGEYFPTLASLPVMQGHMGVLGTQMFGNYSEGIVYISSFGSTDFAGGSVALMIKILGILNRIQ